MRKSLTCLLTFILSFSLIAFSQKSRLGVVAGVSLANTHIKAESISISADSKIGLTAGVIADIPMAETFSFQPALNYVQKGAKSKISDVDYESKLTVHYAEIPLNFLYKPNMQNVQFFAGAGPSIAIALSGKEKEKDNGSTTTYTYKFGNDPDKHDMKRADFGANFIAGIETKTGFIAAVNYNLGLSNVAPGDSNDGTAKNRYWGFKIGYMFNKKK